MNPYHLFILKEYLTKLIGIHYPVEIVTLIMMINYVPTYISCGEYFTCLIKNNIYVWGSNKVGQLGLGHTINFNFPQKLVSAPDIRSIRCGYDFVIASTYTFGKLYSWGYNDNGELGLGDSYDKFSPMEFMLETNSTSEIKSICNAMGHTIVLLESGKCYSWGLNKNGQLGLGDMVSRYSPHEIKFEADIRSIACGAYHNIALSNIESNICYVWGSGLGGKLGLGDYHSKNLPTKLFFIESVVSVHCGGFHTIVLTSNSFKMYVWGENDKGQLGLGDTNYRYKPQELHLMNVLSISCGTKYTLALTKNGKLYSWGDNLWGQLGLGGRLFSPLERTRSARPNFPPENWGHTSNQNFPQEIKFGIPIKFINCGGCHTIAITSDDEIYVWGKNNQGQLGLGDNEDRCVPCHLDLII